MWITASVVTGTIQSLPVKLLRPTQIAVGRRLVKLKRHDLEALKRQPQELVDYILTHPIRVVIGPKALCYIIDHHHLGSALLAEGFKTAPLAVEHDLSHLTLREFWPEMARRHWTYPVDGRGRTRKIADIPASLKDMEDDPYRSLAGFVRMKGGFQKTATPYVEFRWAEYFRPLIKRKLVEGDFDKAVRKGIELAKADEAKHLPGFIGKA